MSPRVRERLNCRQRPLQAILWGLVLAVAASLAGGQIGSGNRSSVLGDVDGVWGSGLYGEGATSFRPEEAGHDVSGIGDFNADGVGDLIVGAPRAARLAISPYTANGKATLVYGRASRLTAESALADIAASNGTEGFVINGAPDRQQLGRALSAAGDVNGDGYGDVIAGLSRADGISSSSPWQGRSYVIFGGPDLVIGGIRITDIEEGDGSKGFVIFGANRRDALGFSVAAAGDVNGDGVDDLIAGAPHAESFPHGRLVGKSYVIYGRKSGIGPWVTTSGLGQADGFTIYGAEKDGMCGLGVAGAGDVNGDGIDDIVVGAPRAGRHFFGRPNAGVSYVIFGRAGPRSEVDLRLHHLANDDEGFTIVGPGEDCHAGSSVAAAGDMNGDGFADIVVGAPMFGSSQGGDPLEDRLRSGAAFVIYGKAAGFGGVVDLAGMATGNSNTGFMMRGTRLAARTGASVAGTGDVNGDGFADLIVGAHLAGEASRELFRRGEAYLVYGSAAAPSGPLDLARLGTDQNAFGTTFQGTIRADNAGHSVAGAGDIDGDGLPDLLIGAIGAFPDSHEYYRGGGAYALYGSTVAASATYRAFAKSGDPRPLAVGITGNGTGSAMPDARCWIDFSTGDNGSGGASLQTVTLLRNKRLTLDAADTVWSIASDRVNWAEARITLRYTDEEIAAFEEAELRIFRSDSLGGQWVALDSTVDAARNTISGSTSAFSSVYLAIAEPSDPPAAREWIGMWVR